jgi:hypothetical protein
MRLTPSIMKLLCKKVQTTTVQSVLVAGGTWLREEIGLAPSVRRGVHPSPVIWLAHSRIKSDSGYDPVHPSSFFEKGSRS